LAKLADSSDVTKGGTAAESVVYPTFSWRGFLPQLITPSEIVDYPGKGDQYCVTNGYPVESKQSCCQVTTRATR